MDVSEQATNVECSFEIVCDCWICVDEKECGRHSDRGNTGVRTRSPHRNVTTR